MIPHRYEQIPGGFWFKDGYDKLLDYFATLNRRVRFVEVGTCHGKSAAYMAVEAANRGIRLDFTCVDNFVWSPIGYDTRSLRADWEKNTSGLGISLVALDSVAAARSCPKKDLDAVWIDADHNYGPVLADIKAWTPLIRPGGIIGGDDYDMMGVRKAVVETGPHSVHPGYRLDKGYEGPWTYWMRTVP